MSKTIVLGMDVPAANRHKLKVVAVATLLLSLGAAVGKAEEVTTTLNDQQSVAVTIYNENLALIKDQRSVAVPNGDASLAFRGVSAKLRPETALLRNTKSPESLRIIEQNFDFDLLTPQKLLEKYTGKNVRIARMNPATGKETIEQAKILSTQSGVVVRIGDRIETNPGGRIIFDELPANLRDEPTLSVQLNNKASGRQTMELSYLTGGLSWKADYVAELNEDDTKLDLMGWVTLNNNSGASYKNASMQLVAGDVNQVQQNPQVFRRTKGMATMEMAAADGAMAEESLFEYHLYSLNRPTTINDKQKKQVSLLTASEVQVRKELLLQGHNHYYHSSRGRIGQKLKLGVYVHFNNEEKDGLGLPLPKGIVRVYKRDSKGNAQFVGEDSIDHTPNKEKVRLKLGDSFDVTADKNQTDFKVIERGPKRTVYESTYAIKIKNAKKQAVSVVVREPIPGDWQMQQESAKHIKKSAGTAEWKLSVPAEGSTTLNYTVRTRF